MLATWPATGWIHRPGLAPNGPVCHLHAHGAGRCVRLTALSTNGALARKLPRSIDSGAAFSGPLIDRPGKTLLLNESDVMKKLIGSILFAVAAALAAPAMAASHAGGAPMKASEPAGNASGPAKKAAKKKAMKKEAKKEEKK